MGLLGSAEGGDDWTHGSPDSATQRLWNVKPLLWGNFGALRLGEEETYSGDFGESRGDRAVGWVRSSRGLNGI
jgi:hypothetical protein